MFDIAWTELLVIIVVALVVVGPKDLPRMMRTVGQWAGRARAMADQFRRSFDDIARQSELEELRAEVSKLQQNYIPPAAEIESAMYPEGMPSSPTAGIPVSSPVAEAPASTPAPASAPVEPPSETVRS